VIMRAAPEGVKKPAGVREVVAEASSGVAVIRAFVGYLREQGQTRRPTGIRGAREEDKT
jgi:hypothetical protein